MSQAGHAIEEFELDDSNAQVIAALCRRLDGLPLALELAAARTRGLSPAELLARLDGTFSILGTTRSTLGRHDTLGGALAWSYDLLNDDEHHVFRTLAVFRGGFSLDGAEAVARTGRPPTSPTTSPRSSMVHSSRRTTAPTSTVATTSLEVIHEYALTLLQRRGGDSSARRHHREYLNERGRRIDGR